MDKLNIAYKRSWLQSDKKNYMKVEAEIAKNLAKIAEPLTKVVVDYWIAPKIKSMGEKWMKNKNIQDHFFSNTFSNYLIDKYKNLSIINIIAFRNQQRLFSNIYFPLSIQKRNNFGVDEKIVINNYPDNLIPKYKNVLVTDTAGMGKSTLSKKLFLEVINNNAGVPIFVELRRLSRRYKLIDLIFDELKIINEEINKTFVLDLLRRGDFVIFLDGFDEIATSEKKKVTQDIQSFIQKASNNSFVLTSRPEASLTSFGQFQEFKINPLKKEEAYELLKKYDKYGSLSEKLINKLEDEKLYHSIHEFLSNPLLISLLYTAFEFKHKVPLKKHIFYRQVYDALFETHDLSKGDFFERNKHSKLGIDDFHTILRYLAFICLKMDKIEFTKDELLNVIKRARVNCGIIEFKDSLFFKDLTSTVPVFSNEGVYFKWTHKSIYEYFVSQFIYLDTGSERSKILRQLVDHPQSIKFYNIIDIYSNVDFKSFLREVAYIVIKDFLNYCESSYSEISVSNKLKVERQELTFQYSQVLIQLDNYEVRSYSERCFLIAKAQLGIEKHGIPVTEYYQKPKETNNCTLLNKENDTIHNSVIFILSNSSADVVRLVKFNKELELDNFNIKKNTAFKVDDNKSSVLNSKKNFAYTNNILNAFIHNYTVLDYKKCIQFVKKIEDELSGESKNLFLSI